MWINDWYIAHICDIYITGAQPPCESKVGNRNPIYENRQVRFGGVESKWIQGFMRKELVMSDVCKTVNIKDINIVAFWSPTVKGNRALRSFRAKRETSNSNGLIKSNG